MNITVDAANEYTLYIARSQPFQMQKGVRGKAVRGKAVRGKAARGKVVRMELHGGNARGLTMNAPVVVVANEAARASHGIRAVNNTNSGR